MYYVYISFYAIAFHILTACTGAVLGTACTSVSAAPIGTIIVTFPAAAVQVAVIGILPTCPYTKLTVSCGTIPAQTAVNTVTHLIFYKLYAYAL